MTELKILIHSKKKCAMLNVPPAPKKTLYIICVYIAQICESNLQIELASKDLKFCK
jgi:hypothetical protein